MLDFIVTSLPSAVCGMYKVQDLSNNMNKNMEEQLQDLTKRQRRELKKQEKLAKREKGDRNKKITNFIIIFVIVLVLAGISWLVVKGGNIINNNVAPDNDPTLGAPSPQLVITEFSDFSCPACQLAASNIKEAVSAYPDKVQLVYNNYNLNHRWSEKSAEAGECAFTQGKFWEYCDVIFEKQSDWVDADDAIDKFKSYAKEIGLDESQFNDCLDSDQTKDRVEYDMKEAQAKQIVSTPTFFIGENRVLGAKTVDEFKSLIEEQLMAVNK